MGVGFRRFSVFEQIRVVRPNGATKAVHGQNDREAHGDLRGLGRDDEEREHPGQSHTGQVFAFFIIAAEAAEVAVGLAIVLAGFVIAYGWLAAIIPVCVKVPVLGS